MIMRRPPRSTHDSWNYSCIAAMRLRAPFARRRRAGVDLREVPGDCVRAEAELGRDLVVPAAGDDKLDDLTFGSDSSPSDVVRRPIRRSSERALSDQTRRRAARRSRGLVRGLAGDALRCVRRRTVPSARSVRASSKGSTSCGGSGTCRCRVERSPAGSPCGEEKSRSGGRSGGRAVSPFAARRSICASNDSAWRRSPIQAKPRPSRARQLGEVPVKLLVVEEMRDSPPARAGTVVAELRTASESAGERRPF